MRKLSVVLALLVTVAMLAVTTPAQAQGRKWPGGRITYVDLTKDKDAVKRAVQAWNRSGIKVRFVKVKSKRRAQLHIRNSPRVPSGCGSGLATLGFTPGRKAFVNILHGSDADGQACAWPGQTLVVAHELGHVLGLEHTDRGCSLMNTSHTNGVAPTQCLGDDINAARPGKWRCGIFARKDLKRAQRMYGGRIKLNGPTWCNAADPIPATGPISLTPDYFPTLNITRGAEPALPAWIGTWGLGAPGYEVHLTPGACTAVPGDDATVQTRTTWDGIPVGGTATTQVWSEVPGTYCVSVWQFDQVGNYATVPSTAMVTLEGTSFRAPVLQRARTPRLDRFPM